MAVKENDRERSSLKNYTIIQDKRKKEAWNSIAFEFNANEAVTKRSEDEIKVSWYILNIKKNSDYKYRQI